MSAFGAYNMAGNVAEWTVNDSSDGFLATGGAWGDPTYTFSQFGGRPGFFSSDKLGFRCVRVAPTGSGDQGGLRIELDQEVPTFTATSPQEFAKLAAAYQYEKAPLDARIEQTTETPEWNRERITFNGANGRRAIAYLYLPAPRAAAAPGHASHSRPAMSMRDSDRCPMPWTIEWRRSSRRGGRRLASCSRATANVRGRPVSSVPTSAPSNSSR